MPRPNDSPDIATSKILSYILRHGAEKEGLHMQSDGYIKLNDVLSRPKLRGIDVETVLRLVAENAKQRFELFYGYDPSPPRPKVRKQTKPKKAKLPRPIDTTTPSDPDGSGRIDAAEVDDLRAQLVEAKIDDPPDPEQISDLPLISIPIPTDSPSLDPDEIGEYFIRATQGHSLQVDSTHLTPILNSPEGRLAVGEMVHGTRSDLYPLLLEEGLSRMSRQHIHLAPALTNHRITPRPTSTLYIYLDLEKLVKAGIPVYVSANGVVLTPGDGDGRVAKEFWRRIEKVEKGVRRVVWYDGQEKGEEREGERRDVEET